MSTVLYDVAGGCATITLNRPDKLNAINRQMLKDLGQSLATALDSDAAQIILLKGAGRAFCAGDDLDELSSEPMDQATAIDFANALQSITRQIMLGPKIVVCAVHGWAIGGGASWPLNADICIWSETARVKFPEAKHGLFPSGAATFLLQEFCGPHRAQEILLLGETLTMPRLVEERIAKASIPNDRIEAETTAVFHSLLDLPPESLVRYKAHKARSIKSQLESTLERETHMLIESALSVADTDKISVKDEH